MWERRPAPDTQPVLTNDAIKKVRQLLKEKLPNGKPKWAHRQIAKLAKVSKGTVGNISTGRRNPKKPDPKLKDQPIPEALCPSPFKSLGYKRCPGCGALCRLVNKFCLECVTEVHERNRKLSNAIVHRTN